MGSMQVLFAAAQAERGFESTLQRFQVNLDRLLDIESQAQKVSRDSRDALVHAGKMASVGRMVAGVNHEIKRPLASIRMLLECSLDVLAAGDGLRLEDNLRRMLRIVDQAAKLSRRLEGFSRKEAASMGPVSLPMVAADALAVLAPQLQGGGCRVQMACDVPPVLADADRLTFVLVNLVDNAIAAMEGCEHRVIQLRAERDEAGTVISVRDHGLGLTEQVRERLFEEFFTTKPIDKGLGLGLAIAAGMVHEMGGEISARNHPGGGAEFVVRLGNA
jgi:two-component system C4-dicarboxylate transport sensor histidine kinase DctB